MKTTSTILCLAALFASSLAYSEDQTGATDKTKVKASESKAKVSETKATVSKTESKKTSDTRTVETQLTGSYIKRNYHRSGQITDGPSQVVVLDRNTIEQSGAADLNQLLIRRGLRH